MPYQPKGRVRVSARKPEVYEATNIITGKRYIGATSIGFEKRRTRHLNLYKRDRGCPRFYDALKKYGKNSFDWRVLRTFKNVECAFSFERIAIFLSRPEYNVTSGGHGTRDHCPHNRRKVLCLENGAVFDTLTAAARAYRVGSGDISAVCRGRHETAGGAHFIYYSGPISDSERFALLKQAIVKFSKDRRKRGLFGLIRFGQATVDGGDRLGRRASGPMKRAKKVLCFETGQVFESASAAAEHFDIARSSIIEVCLGKNNRRAAGGFRFKYLTAD